VQASLKTWTSGVVVLSAVVLSIVVAALFGWSFPAVDTRQVAVVDGHGWTDYPTEYAKVQQTLAHGGYSGPVLVVADPGGAVAKASQASPGPTDWIVGQPQPDGSLDQQVRNLFPFGAVRHVNGTVVTVTVTRAHFGWLPALVAMMATMAASAVLVYMVFLRRPATPDTPSSWPSDERQPQDPPADRAGRGAASHPWSPRPETIPYLAKASRPATIPVIVDVAAIPAEVYACVRAASGVARTRIDTAGGYVAFNDLVVWAVADGSAAEPGDTVRGVPG
jgi:hypothetical protein